jgi:hypothetical protein
VGRPSDTFKQYIGRNSNHLFERERRQDEVPVAYAENCLILSLIQQALDCDDSKLRAAVANFRSRLVFRRVIPAVYSLQIGELQNGKATGDRPL